MIYIISPAKSLKEDIIGHPSYPMTKARLFKESWPIVERLKQLEVDEIQSLMDVSMDIAATNYKRFQSFSKMHTKHNSASAGLLFDGSVYQHLDLASVSAAGMDFAQANLRILSGLYGLLRPLDAIQPYRLEMGTHLAVNGQKNLYNYWGDTIMERLTTDFRGMPNKVLINVASQEYFKSINKKKFPYPIIDVDFKTLKDGQYKTLGYPAKIARGAFVRFAIDHQITTVDHLLGFDWEGYVYDESLSNAERLVFVK